jgi:aspartate-semialdehyde dehydrogenase
MEIIDNVLPHIGGEEEKMETETCKLLGEFDGAAVSWHGAEVSASCNRVPTLDGHLENVWAETAESADPVAAEQAFRAMPTVDLPSSPEQLIHVHEDPNRPQPRLDRDADGGQAISVGPVQATASGIQFDCLAHNTIRGAAGASVLNGELLLERGYV